MKGVPVDSEEYSPLILLIPHLRSQIGNCGISMLNISSILHSILVTSCILKEEQQKELEKECFKD